jgi:hypothetical protein
MRAKQELSIAAVAHAGDWPVCRDIGEHSGYLVAVIGVVQATVGVHQTERGIRRQVKAQRAVADGLG